MDDDTWLFDPWRTFAIYPRQSSEMTEGTALNPPSVLSQYNQIVVNPCCGPDTLKRVGASSFLLSKTSIYCEHLSQDDLRSFSFDQEAASILTSTTGDDSVSTSSVQSFVTPPAPKHEPRKKQMMAQRPLGRRPPDIPRPQRPRRRVCLLKDCHCPYHRILERSIGPIDVDSFCENTSGDSNKTVVSSILEDLEESLRPHRSTGELSSSYSKQAKSSRTIASGETSASSDTTEGPSWQVRITVTPERSLAKQKETLSPDDSDIVSLADSKSSQLSGPVEFDEVVAGKEEELSVADEYIIDETELSRELSGYMEGFEPEVIYQYNALDVMRWEAEQYRDADGKSKASTGRKSISSSGRKSNSSPSRKSISSSGRKSNSSSFYPYSIPESAVEI